MSDADEKEMREEYIKVLEQENQELRGKVSGSDDDLLDKIRCLEETLVRRDDRISELNSQLRKLKDREIWADRHNKTEDITKHIPPDGCYDGEWTKVVICKGCGACSREDDYKAMKSGLCTLCGHQHDILNIPKRSGMWVPKMANREVEVRKTSFWTGKVKMVKEFKMVDVGEWKIK